MYLKTVQAMGIKSMFEVLQAILNDVNVIFTPQGVKVVALDTAKISLVSVFLDANNFEEYTFDREVIAGLNMSNVYKLLKTITVNDILKISLTNTDYMEFEIQNSVKKSKSMFQLKLLDIDEDIIEIPNIDMNIITTLQSIDFQRLCRDMSNISKEVTIKRQDRMMTISCSGDFANQSTEIECSDETADDRCCAGTYSLRYINLFTKATSMCSNIQIIQERNELPIVFKYNIANLGDMQFFLASHVQDSH